MKSLDITLTETKSTYLPGTRIESYAQSGKSSESPRQRKGTVEFVDDAGNINVRWDEGGCTILRHNNAEHSILPNQRFRDENGVCVMSIEDIVRLTKDEADAYYQDGMRYMINGQEYTFVRHPVGYSDAEVCFLGEDGFTIYCGVETLATFLPGVASEGQVITRCDDEQTKSPDELSLEQKG